MKLQVGFILIITGVNNGTGTTTPVAGQVNGAQQFNGTTNKIDVPANPSLDFTANGNFSVEFWYKVLNYSINSTQIAALVDIFLRHLEMVVGLNAIAGM